MNNCCIDFGHNSMKAVSSTHQEIIPAILGETKKLFMPDIKENKKQSKHNINNEVDINDLQIKYQDNEYFFGDLARRQSELCIQNVNDEDMNEYETKVMILAAAAYLTIHDNSRNINNQRENDNQLNINLVTDLPITHYRDKKEVMKFMNQFKGDHDIDFYDFQKGEYENKKIYITNVDVKPQAFLAFMSEILNDKGNIAGDKKEIAQGLCVTIDPGYYSTDVYVSNNLDPVIRIPVKPIPGMYSAYKLLSNYFYDQHGIRKEIHEIERYARSGEITIKNKNYDLTPVINNAYETLARKIVSEINNLLPFWPEVNYWFLAGGGAVPLYEEFKTHYNDITIIDNPQMANALGGLKWSKRIFEGG